MAHPRRFGSSPHSARSLLGAARDVLPLVLAIRPSARPPGTASLHCERYWPGVGAGDR